MMVRLRSTFGAETVERSIRYMLDADKAIESWFAPDFADPQHAAAEMRACASIADPRARPLWHLVYSYAADEPVIVPAARAVVDRLHAELSARYVRERARRPTLLWIAAAHADAAMRHVHEVLLTRDADTGEIVVPEGPVAELLRAFAQDETRRIVEPERSGPGRQSARARDGEIFNGHISLGRWLGELLVDVRDWNDHDSRLAAFGIACIERRSGYVYVDRTTEPAIHVALSRVLDPQTRARLGPRERDRSVNVIPAAYPSYAARRFSPEMHEPTLPGGRSTVARWRLLREAGYPVGRLGEFARGRTLLDAATDRQEPLPMIAYDYPRLPRIGKREHRFPAPQRLVVTDHARLLVGVRPSPGERRFVLLDGMNRPGVASLAALPIDRRARGLRIIEHATNDHVRAAMLDVPIEDRRTDRLRVLILGLPGQKDDFMKRSSTREELQQALLAEARRREAAAMRLDDAPDRDAHLKLAQRQVEHLEWLASALDRAPAGARYVPTYAPNGEIVVDDKLISDLGELFPNGEFRLPEPAIEHVALNDERLQKLLRSEAQRNLDIVNAYEGKPLTEKADQDRQLAALTAAEEYTRLAREAQNATGTLTIAVPIEQLAERTDVDPELLTKLQTIFPPPRVRESGRDDRPVFLVGKTWDAFYRSFAAANPGLHYGVYRNERDERVGALFTVDAGRLTYVCDAREGPFANLDLNALEAELGPIVSPGHPAAQYTLDSRRSLGVAELDARLVAEFQEAAARGRAGVIARDEPEPEMRGDRAFAQNSIGAARSRAQTNTIGDAQAPLEQNPRQALIADLLAQYQASRASGADLEPFVERTIRRYEVLGERLQDKIAALRTDDEHLAAEAIDARAEELRLLANLGYLQDETFISLAFAKPAQFAAGSTFRDFVEHAGGLSDEDRRAILEEIDERSDLQLAPDPPRVRYDPSLRAAAAFLVAEMDDERIGYYRTDDRNTPRFFEKDDRYYLRRAPKADDIDVALRMAQARYGAVDVTGDDRFVDRVLRRAVQLGIEVTTERHQKRIADLKAEFDRDQIQALITTPQRVVDFPQWALATESAIDQDKQTTYRAYEDKRLTELVGRSAFAQGIRSSGPAEGATKLGIPHPEGVIDGTLLGAVATGARTVALVRVDSPERETVARHILFTDIPASADARAIESYRDRTVSIDLGENGVSELYFGKLGETREVARSR